MLPDYLLHSNERIGNKRLHDWSQLFYDYMKSLDDLFDPGHRIDHVLRVTKTAIHIALKENASIPIILPAAILHDTVPIGKFDQMRAMTSRLSADNAIHLLHEWRYPKQYYQAIKHAILAHSHSAGIKPMTLEAKIVQDADRLDALGAIGIARSMAVGFKNDNTLYDIQEPFPHHRNANDRDYILDHFYVKLFALSHTLHTQSAILEAKKRIALMEYYIKELADEIGVPYYTYQAYLEKKTPLTHIEVHDTTLESA